MDLSGYFIPPDKYKRIKYVEPEINCVKDLCGFCGKAHYDGKVCTPPRSDNGCNT